MSKTALFFPGQASQYVGMGQELFDRSDKVRNLYELASDLIGVDIARLSFEGPPEELKKTRFTQPAILLHSLSVLTLIEEQCPSFDYACGHSLGEYGALAACGALSHEDAVRAVVKRAALMEEACNKNPGTMAAIIGLDQQAVEKICDRASTEGIVVPANFNSSAQIVISGSIEAINTAVALAKENGAKRAIILEVGGAFHSPLMESAVPPFAEFLQTMSFKDPIKPVIANVTAEPVISGAEIENLLVRQLTSPVKWSQTMQYLVANNVTQLYEIGPGKVLISLAKREMKPAKITNLDKLADLEALSTVTA